MNYVVHAMLTTKTEDIEILMRIEYHKVWPEYHTCSLLNVIIHLPKAEKRERERERERESPNISKFTC